MDHDIEIFGISRIPVPKPSPSGSVVLATFDARLNAITLHGCAFMRTARQGLTVLPPRIDNGGRRERYAIEFADDLRNQTVRAVQEAYRAIGGTDGEWMPREDDEIPRAARLSATARAVVVETIKRGDGDAEDGLRRFLAPPPKAGADEVASRAEPAI